MGRAPGRRMEPLNDPTGTAAATLAVQESGPGFSRSRRTCLGHVVKLSSTKQVVLMVLCSRLLICPANTKVLEGRPTGLEPATSSRATIRTHRFAGVHWRSEIRLLRRLSRIGRSLAFADVRPGCRQNCRQLWWLLDKGALAPTGRPTRGLRMQPAPSTVASRSRSPSMASTCCVGRDGRCSRRPARVAPRWPDRDPP
jgi:hypothetical protein